MKASVDQLAFLKRRLAKAQELKIQKLAGDGGLRRYSRAKLGDKSFILMDCGPKDLSLKNFINIQKRLDSLRLAPKLFDYDLKQGFLLLEDLGDCHLEDIFFNSPPLQVMAFYRKALLQLIKLQERVLPLKTDPLFDPAFFLKEIEQAHYWLKTLCQPYFQPYLFRPPRALLRDMERLLSFFPPEAQVYCHRDYHSRNLMIKKGRVILIDFQDAGLGPWSYDLSSLLYDCYIGFKPGERQALIQFYFENLGPGLKNKARSSAHIELALKRQLLQRGLKACGCFSAFKIRDGRPDWLKYIPPTLQLVARAGFELGFFALAEYAKDLYRSCFKLCAPSFSCQGAGTPR